jgi:hypothetical protein
MKTKRFRETVTSGVFSSIPLGILGVLNAVFLSVML